MSERKAGEKEKGSAYERRTASKKRVRRAYRRRETQSDGVREGGRERETGRVRYIAGLSGQSAVCQI